MSQPLHRLRLRYLLPALIALVAVQPCGASLAGPAPQPGAPASTPAKPSPAKIYKYLSGGTPSFSDVPPAKQAYVVYTPSCFACNLHSNIDWQSTHLYLNEFAHEISDAAQQYAVDPTLVRAVIHAESGFNAQARSNKGAMGLMQLMPATARSLGIAQPQLPGHNIRGGVQYLAQLLARFRNDITLATAAYNAGPEAVQRYAGIPPYAETQVYVQRVKILHQRYRDAWVREPL